MDMLKMNNTSPEFIPKKENHTYPYSDYILPPSTLGSSPSAGALNNDIYALIAYVKVLVSGTSNAQWPPGPLGNQYFIDKIAIL